MILNLLEISPVSKIYKHSLYNYNKIIEDNIELGNDYKICFKINDIFNKNEGKFNCIIYTLDNFNEILFDKTLSSFDDNFIILFINFMDKNQVEKFQYLFNNRVSYLKIDYYLPELTIKTINIILKNNGIYKPCITKCNVIDIEKKIIELYKDIDNYSNDINKFMKGMEIKYKEWLENPIEIKNPFFLFYIYNNPFIKYNFINNYSQYIQKFLEIYPQFSKYIHFNYESLLNLPNRNNIIYIIIPLFYQLVFSFIVIKETNMIPSWYIKNDKLVLYYKKILDISNLLED